MDFYPRPSHAEVGGSRCSFCIVLMSSSSGMLVADRFQLVSLIGMWVNLPVLKNFWPAFWTMTAGHKNCTTFAD